MKKTVVVRGAGDLATGTIIKLYNSGFNVVALEVSQPTTIRRYVAFSEAIPKGETIVEGVRCKFFKSFDDVKDYDGVSILIDPNGRCIENIKPIAVVDGIIAKKNIGTNIKMAEIVIALGPGFYAGKDCHAVIETKRGHSLGKIYYEGEAIKNTGIPGKIGGYGIERVIHSPKKGVVKVVKDITSKVEVGELIAYVDDIPIGASISGLIRGMIGDGMFVDEGTKIADIDPRSFEASNCYTISDKARCIAGGVLEAILYLQRKE